MALRLSQQELVPVTESLLGRAVADGAVAWPEPDGGMELPSADDVALDEFYADVWDSE
jgi:hypothetical protein